MSLYDILDLHENCTIEEIETSYKKKIRKVHPTVTKQGADEFVAVNQAYKILKDKYKRQFYDLIGDPCIYILEKEKESFIIVRMFDTTNIYCYICFFLVILINIYIFPFLYYFKKQFYVYYLLFSCNIFLFVINLRNALRIDYEYYKIVLYLSLKYFTYTLNLTYYNVFILLFIEITNVTINYNSFKTYLVSVLYILSICFIKKFDYPHLNLIIILVTFDISLYLQKVKNNILIFISILLILYLSTILFIDLNFTNWLIFIPQLIFILLISFLLSVLYKYYKINVPKYTLKRFSIESNFILV